MKKLIIFLFLLPLVLFGQNNIGNFGYLNVSKLTSFKGTLQWLCIPTPIGTPPAGSIWMWANGDSIRIMNSAGNTYTLGRGTTATVNPTVVVGGVNTQFQYNNAGVLAGSSILTQVSNSLYFGSDVWFTATADRVLSVASSPSGVGKSLTIQAGGSGSSDGGNLVLKGGNGSISTGNGGKIFLYGGGGGDNNSPAVWLGYSTTTTPVGNVYAKTQTANANNQTVATTAYVDRILPTTTGNGGKFLTTSGTVNSWSMIPAAGNNNEFQFNSSGVPAGSSHLSESTTGIKVTGTVIGPTGITMARGASRVITVQTPTSGNANSLAIEAPPSNIGTQGGNLYLGAGAGLTAGDVFIYGNIYNTPSPGFPGPYLPPATEIGNIWLGSPTGTGFTNPVFAETVESSDSSDRVATTAFAKQLAFAASSGTSGTGTANYVAKWTASSVQGNSQIRDDGTYVSIGAAPGTYKFSVTGTSSFNGDVTMPLDKNVKFLNGSAAVLSQMRGTATGMEINSPGGYALHFTGATGDEWIQAGPDKITLYYNNVDRFWTSATGTTTNGSHHIIGNQTFSNGANRLVGIQNVTSGTGKTLTIYGGGSDSGGGGSLNLTGGTGDVGSGAGGNVHVYGGGGAMGNSPAVWLGYSDNGITAVGNTYAKTQNAGTNNQTLATTAFVTTAVGSGGSLPSQTGNSGKMLVTNGTAALWGNIFAINYTWNDNIYSFFGSDGDYKIGFDPTMASSGSVRIANSSDATIANFATNDVNFFYNGTVMTTISSFGLTNVGNITTAGNFILNDNQNSTNRTIMMANYSSSGTAGSLTIHASDGTGFAGNGGAMIVRAGNSGTAANGGNLYVLGGDGTSTDGNTWLGYSNAGTTAVGDVYAKTQTSTDNTQKVATTAFVTTAVAATSTLKNAGNTKVTASTTGATTTGTHEASSGFAVNNVAGVGGAAGTTYTVNSTGAGLLNTITIAGGIVTKVVVFPNASPLPKPRTPVPAAIIVAGENILYWVVGVLCLLVILLFVKIGRLEKRLHDIDGK